MVRNTSVSSCYSVFATCACVCSCRGDTHRTWQTQSVAFVSTLSEGGLYIIGLVLITGHDMHGRHQILQPYVHMKLLSPSHTHTHIHTQVGARYPCQDFTLTSTHLLQSKGCFMLKRHVSAAVLRKVLATQMHLCFNEELDDACVLRGFSVWPSRTAVTTCSSRKMARYCDTLDLTEGEDMFKFKFNRRRRRRTKSCGLCDKPK